MAIFNPDLTHMREAKIPLRFRIDDGPLEFPAETIGISPDQFIMSTRFQLEVGMRLSLKLRIPVEISGNSYSDLEIFGWVVGVSKIAHRKYGYQIDLERDE